MNANDRLELDREPVPMTTDGPAQACVVYDAMTDGWRVAWQIGREKHPMGRAHRRVRDALEASIYLNSKL